MSTSPNGRPEVKISSLQCKSSLFCILLKPTPHLSFQQEDMVDPYLNQIPKSYFWCDRFEGRTQPLQSDPYFTKHIFTWFKKAIGCIVLKVEVRWQPAGERDVSLDGYVHAQASCGAVTSGGRALALRGQSCCHFLDCFWGSAAVMESALSIFPEPRGSLEELVPLWAEPT